MDHRKKTQKLCSECGVVISGTYYNHDDGKVKREKYFFCFYVLIEGVLCVLPGGTQEENTKDLQRVQRSYQRHLLHS